ncbi:hypothetical protein [Leptospira perdikensis]|uniref:Uncharacterized protein n=1 Tax=Leptospira perdikensis TaxID=2484948 RepID=A0A4R9JJD5_9LEPT|nr:hypothetical protein [Leptospira perdikensis]TGL41458.1 hypothetical protein EHQ49_07785 [Leptospira perdikensis]
MRTIVMNVIWVILGIFLGSAVNMGLITVSGEIIPPPKGADVTTMEGLKASIHLFEPKHFLFPFLAHALGTFVGSAFVSRFATSQRLKYSFVIGLFFLVGGVTNILILPSPLWFVFVDLACAYLPMSYLAYITFRKNPLA